MMIFIIFEKFLFLLSFVFLTSFFFVLFSSSFHSKRRTKSASHTTTPTTQQHTQQKNKKINRNQSSSDQMQGARQSDVFFGERESGQDVRQSNVTAVQAVANIVRSSLGPVGLDKVYSLFFFREGKSQRWHHRGSSFFSLR